MIRTALSFQQSSSSSSSSNKQEQDDRTMGTFGMWLVARMDDQKGEQTAGKPWVLKQYEIA